MSTLKRTRDSLLSFKCPMPLFHSAITVRHCGDSPSPPVYKGCLARYTVRQIPLIEGSMSAEQPCAVWSFLKDVS